MTQKSSPWVEGKYGWSFGESGWNTGMDENLVKFSFLFDRNVDGVTATLPAPVDGLAYFLTTDNRFYFAIGTPSAVWYSSPAPKNSLFQIKSTGIVYNFDGTTATQVPSNADIKTRLEAIELTLSGLGTASTKNTEFFVGTAALADSTGASGIGYLLNTTGSQARTVENKLQDYVNVKDFGPVGTTDDSITVQKAIDSGKKLYFPAGTYTMNVTVSAFFDWIGDGCLNTIFKPVNAAVPTVKNMYYEPDWQFSSLSKIGFEGLGTRTGVGFSYGDPSGYTSGAEFVGRVVMNNVSFKNLDKGVYKAFGNIGNVYNNCSWLYNNYGVYARGAQLGSASSSIMQSTNDTYNQGEAHANTIAAFAYIDTTLPLGQLTFNMTTIQFNFGFGLFMSTETNANGVHPVLMNNVWDEGNGTAYPGQSGHTVTIDTITGPQTLAPKGLAIYGGLRSYVGIGQAGAVNSINTTSQNGSLSVWGDQRNAINLISGFGDGANSWTQLAFAAEGSESTVGAAIRSTNVSGTPRNIQFLTNNLNSAPLTLTSNGSVQIGTTAAQYGSPAAGTHQIWGDVSTAGDLEVSIGSRFGIPVNFYVADGNGVNAALTALSVGKVTSTGRSINAGGTINASGADYAEYEHNNGLVISKGDIVGFKEDGTLTNLYSESVRFGIKSTNPALVGGDDWGGVEREFVDRVAYCGKVPVNVYDSTPGQYVIASKGSKDSIVGVCVTSPSFEQYLLAVGKVNKVLDDGRAEVVVITH